MKCRQHPYEPGVGVCASCLRERLLALLAAQNDLSNTYADDDYSHGHHHRHNYSSNRSHQLPAPPLDFPRSVSPYVARRRSVGSDESPGRGPRRLPRFFSTPQVGPTFEDRGGSFGDIGDVIRGRRNTGKFSVLKALFGRRRSMSGPQSSTSWWSALIHGRGRSAKNPPPRSSSGSWGKSLRSRTRAAEKGMSPAAEEEEEESGYSTESPGGYRRPMPTPMRPFPANISHRRYVGAVSGFAVCLSPLVKAGSGGRRGQHAEAGAVGGDPLSRPSPVGVASFGPNRSRKLADFGRFK